MRDEKISLPRILGLHPAIIFDVISAIEEAERGFPQEVMIRVAQATRTFAEQDAIYKQVPKVTNAKAGESSHNYGLAIDFAIFYFVEGKWQLSWDIVKDFDRDKVADWTEVVNIFKRKGFTWGGDFKSIKDSPHLEKMFGFTWQQLLAKYNAKQWHKTPNFVSIPL